MNTTRKLLTPFILLLIFFISPNQFIYGQKEANKVEFTSDGNRIETLHDSSGVSVFLINKATGMIKVSNEVFEKLNKKISIYISNDINDQDKFDFSEASLSTQDESAYFNLENILDENGKGKFRLVIEKVFNKVFVLEGITKN